MGRLPPPSYAQAIGAVPLDSTAGSIATSIPAFAHSPSHRLY